MLPIDIIIFAAIAIVLVFKLWNVLGKHSGNEDSEGGFGSMFQDFAQDKDKDKPSKASKPSKAKRDLAEEAVDVEYEEMGSSSSVAGVDVVYDYSRYGSSEAGLSAIKSVDSAFEPEEFLQGVEGAFEIILNAYVDCDKVELKKLLNKAVYKDFASAIDERMGKGERISELLIGIDGVSIISADLDGGRVARIKVEIKSQQVDACYDQQNVLISGDPHASVSKTDIWVFERDIRSRDPNWLLAETGD